MSFHYKTRHCLEVCFNSLVCWFSCHFCVSVSYIQQLRNKMAEDNNEVPKGALLQMLTTMREELRGFGERIERLEQPQPWAEGRNVYARRNIQEEEEEVPDLEEEEIPSDPFWRQRPQREDPWRMNQARRVETRETHHELKLTPLLYMKIKPWSLHRLGEMAGAYIWVLWL